MSFDDKVIFDSFESNKEQRAIPFYLNGTWIAPNERMVDISRNKSQVMHFIKADIPNNELIVIGNSPDNNKPRNTNLPPRERTFFIIVNGQIKDGSFHVQFEIEVAYKGRDEIVPPVIKNKRVMANVTKEQKEKVSPWAAS